MTTTAPETRHPWAYTAAVPAAADHSVVDRWARVVAAHPDAPALAGEGRQLSFVQADGLARSLALHLGERLRPDDHTGTGTGPTPGGAPVPIGVMAGQTTEAVVGILALVMAERLVVVLDDHLPAARLRHVVELAGVTEVLADGDRSAAAAAVLGADGVVHDLHTLLADAEAGRPESTGDTTVAPIATTSVSDDGSLTTTTTPTTTTPTSPATATGRPGASDPLVLAFTSGSTGMPKGVAITHQQQLDNVEQDAVAIGTAPGDRLALVMPLSFAAGFLFGFSTLLNGGAVVLLDPRDLGTDRVLERMSAEGVNVLVCTPHLLRSIVSSVTQDRVLQGPGQETRIAATKALRVVVTSGEAISGSDVVAARPVLSDTTTVWNALGASEMGCVAFFPVAPGDVAPSGVVPAGYALPNKHVTIVREDGTPAPVGEAGQMLVESAGLTAGYWGAPEKTAEHAGVSADGVPTWRQGDLARMEPDGCIVLLGRADDAVKVRGYLVEPSEIEAAIRGLDDVHDVAVTALVEPPAVTRLVAYVVGRPGRRTPSPAAIRRALRDVLPEYMVPATIVPMPALPRTERGKVDRTELPSAPAIEVEMVEGEYDQWELVVGQIWAEVLGLRGVHLDEDFSALGGDSLSAEEMLAIVQQRLGVDLRASELLEHPTLRSFARHVRSGASALPSHPDIVKVAGARNPGHPPVFCLSGGGALALTFLPLSRYLPDHDVYALQQHGIERRGLPDWSIARAARRYIALMRIVQPHGPYLLVGHSLGGLIALEVATMLTEAGEQVDHVALLDTYLPRTRSESAQLHFGRIEQREPQNTTVRTVKRGLDRVTKRIMPSGLPWGGLFGRRLRAYGAGVLRFGGQKDFDAFFDQAELVTRRHTATPYHGRSTFVLADGNPDVQGWSAVLRGDTRTVRIQSEHSSLLREPHVAELAAVLREALAPADARS